MRGLEPSWRDLDDWLFDRVNRLGKYWQLDEKRKAMVLAGKILILFAIYEGFAGEKHAQRLIQKIQDKLNELMKFGSNKEG